MAVPQGIVRIDAQIMDDVGQEPSCDIDSQSDPSGPLIWNGFKVSGKETVVLAPAAVDQVLVFTDVAMFVMFSDEPFSMRLAATETLMPNLRAFVVGSDLTANGVLTGGVLLTGNGANEAIIKILKIEKYP